MAAKSQIEPFDPKVSDWESYLDRFECYLVANGIDGDDIRRATFLSSCGQAVFNIARDLVAPSKVLETPLGIIKARLNEYFKPKTSAAVHRCAFHQRNQKEGESVTEYVAALKRATRDCQFPDLFNT